MDFGFPRVVLQVRLISSALFFFVSSSPFYYALKMKNSPRKCYSVLIAFVMFSFLLMSSSVTGSEVECIESDLPLLCHGARVARSVVQMKPMKLMDGVEIVRIDSTLMDGGNIGSRSTTGFAYADRVLQYLQTHEIKINLHDVLQRTGATDFMARSMKEIESENEVVGECDVCERKF